MLVQQLGVGHGDYDCGGISDLIANCDRSVVQELLDCGDQVERTVSGQLEDGTPQQGYPFLGEPIANLTG